MGHAWTYEDGWILMSVYLMHGEDGTSLDELIAAADAMSHAIPTSGELSRALTRLASCGVLSEVGDRLVIAEDYMPLLDEASQKRGGLFSTPDKGRKWLAKSELEVDDAIQITISDSRLEKAYKTYIKELKKR